ncbi:serine/threonine-protein kinase [Chondromyces crocatus]|uniref:serine/threonine-protein kinase n=1 Tax=Chondromyces crocatus TaxID=52 RepID=UPI00067D1061|nr:serine/threonine-protein kinase [Chondromyces crocatus]
MAGFENRGAGDRLLRWVPRRGAGTRSPARCTPGDRSDRETLPVGNGFYEIVSRLATGGMAELFLARRVGPCGISHPVVIKRLLPEMQADPATVQAFQAEAWIAARLRHPNVVRFHDFVRHEGKSHLVLEHVEGCTLSAVLRFQAATGRQVPLRDVVAIGIALLRALGHAHALVGEDGQALGLVHRDVSPRNVLLSFEGEVKLTDFGVAKATGLGEEQDPASAPWSASWPPQGSDEAEDAASELPSGERRIASVGVIKGTPGYLAPEQMLGQAVDARTDLFAVGVLLFELLTGRRLFRGRDCDELMRAALATEVPALSSLGVGCPALLEEAVRRALSPEPQQRFEDALEMEEALAAVLVTLGEGPWAPEGGELAALVRAVTGQGTLPRAMRNSASFRGSGRARVSSIPPAAPPDRDRPTVRVLVPHTGERASWWWAPGVLMTALALTAGAIKLRWR